SAYSSHRAPLQSRMEVYCSRSSDRADRSRRPNVSGLRIEVRVNSINARMDRPPQPVRFFVKGMVALVILLSVTLLMDPAPQVLAVRAMIVVGLLVVVVKMVLRRYNIDWPR